MKQFNQSMQFVKRALGCAIFLFSYMYGHAQEVKLLQGEEWTNIPMEQTQSELKPGWKILDFKLKDKVVHYFWGEQSRTLTDDAQPSFLIIPAENEVLVDYAIVQLSRKNGYRRLSKPRLMDNRYERIIPSGFQIQAAQGEGFICRPLSSLSAGEYIVVNLNQKPIGEMEDIKAFPFQVPRK